MEEIIEDKTEEETPLAAPVSGPNKVPDPVMYPSHRPMTAERMRVLNAEDAIGKAKKKVRDAKNAVVIAATATENAERMLEVYKVQEKVADEGRAKRNKLSPPAEPVVGAAPPDGQGLKP